MICLSRFWAYCFLFTVVLADSGVAAAVGIVSCLSFFFWFRLFFTSFGVLLCTCTKRRGGDWIRAGRWMAVLYQKLLSLFFIFFMKMILVMEVVVTFSLLRYSCCLEVNLDFAPLANTSARCRRKCLCTWMLWRQRYVFTVSSKPRQVWLLWLVLWWRAALAM